MLSVLSLFCPLTVIVRKNFYLRLMFSIGPEPLALCVVLASRPPKIGCCPFEAFSPPALPR